MSHKQAQGGLFNVLTKAITEGWLMDAESELRSLVETFVDSVREWAKRTYSSHDKGMQWETDFVQMCRKRGLDVRKEIKGRHDMEVSGYRVQCKKIDQVVNGMVAIDNMRPVKANGGERGYKIIEYDVLSLMCNGSLYLVPVQELQDPCRAGFVRPRLRLEHHSHHLDAWAVFEGEIPNPIDRLFT